MNECRQASTNETPMGRDISKMLPLVPALSETNDAGEKKLK